MSVNPSHSAIKAIDMIFNSLELPCKLIQGHQSLPVFQNFVIQISETRIGSVQGELKG